MLDSQKQRGPAKARDCCLQNSKAQNLTASSTRLPRHQALQFPSNSIFVPDVGYMHILCHFLRPHALQGACAPAPGSIPMGLIPYYDHYDRYSTHETQATASLTSLTWWRTMFFAVVRKHKRKDFRLLFISRDPSHQNDRDGELRSKLS